MNLIRICFKMQQYIRYILNLKMHVTSRLQRWIIYYILAYANKFASTFSKCASD